MNKILLLAHMRVQVQAQAYRRKILRLLAHFLFPYLFCVTTISLFSFFPTILFPSYLPLSLSHTMKNLCHAKALSSRKERRTSIILSFLLLLLVLLHLRMRRSSLPFSCCQFTSLSHTFLAHACSLWVEESFLHPSFLSSSRERERGERRENDIILMFFRCTV